MKHSTISLAFVAGLALAHPAPSPPSAETTSSYTQTIASQAQATSVEMEAEIQRYWTTERILAIDHDPYSTSDPPEIPPELRPLGQEYSGKGAVPSTVGRLFYSVHMADGSLHDSTCTATLLRSQNKATLVTAAHCIHTGRQRPGSEMSLSWHANLLFVPGYHDDVPRANFTIARAFLSSRWIDEREHYVDDRAFIVLNRPDATAPAQDIQFKQIDPPYGTRYIMGYTRSVAFGSKDTYRYGTPAFTGRRLAVSHGTAEDWWRFDHETTGIPSVQSGGSSGGPHFAEFNEQTGVGTVVAVNSLEDYKEEDGVRVTWMLGAPVHDEFSKGLYDAAQVVKPALS